MMNAYFAILAVALFAGFLGWKLAVFWYSDDGHDDNVNNEQNWWNQQNQDDEFNEQTGDQEWT